MSNVEEIRKNRIRKLEKIEAQGLNAYPISVKRTHTIAEALKNFSKLSSAKKQVVLNGRIMSQRGHGGAIFLDIKDGTGKIQALTRKNAVGEKGFKFFTELFDIGDFVELKGILFKTKTKEKSLAVSDFKMLAKSFLPLPEKWHGLKDVEERFRKRYLDLLFNQETKEKFETRSRVVSLLREFLESEEFLEVETPILQPIYGGASAKPFKTHLNAMDMDLYLRISPELYLKRLLVGGFEKVYEIGKCFRNEGVDKSHNPDFTMLEFYWAYADYKEIMKVIEKMFGFLLKSIFKKTSIVYEREKIDFKTPWKRIEFLELLKKYVKIDFDKTNQETLVKKAVSLGIEMEKDRPKAEIADEIYKKYCRPKIIQPTFIINHPLGFQPLAKQLGKDKNKLAAFQLVVAGIEMINGFSELNDPQEQEERFKEQEKLYKEGFGESQRLDKDFIEALEYGMPPAAGFGMGIDRLVALLTNSHTLREVILFPTMRKNNVRC